MSMGRELMDFARVVHALLAEGRDLEGAVQEAEMLLGTAPLDTAQLMTALEATDKPLRDKGRPVGFSKTLDAACLFREFRRKGLSYRAALALVSQLLGVGKSGIEAYTKHAIEPIDEASDRTMARFVLGKWDRLIRARALDPEVGPLSAAEASVVAEVQAFGTDGA